MAQRPPAAAATSLPADTSLRNGDRPDGLVGSEAAPQLVEHAAGERLTAQRLLFTGPTPLVSDEMYVETERGSATRQRHQITVAPNSKVSTNTYFGRFPASYWQRWTLVTEVRVELVAEGAGRVALVASDYESESRTVAVADVAAAPGRPVVLSVPLDKFVDGGGLWLEAETGDESLVLSQVRWTVTAPEAVRPTAVVICTFNRVEDCLNTLEALADDPQPLDVLDAVYVIDQGSDPVESRERFGALSAKLGDTLRYIRQPNLGGAGGFSRGLYEVTEVSHAEHANVLFMDDDVLCEPDIVIRMTAFANRTGEPVIVGGQMLYLLHPRKLHVQAEYADLQTLTPARVTEVTLTAADVTGEDEDGEPNHQDVRVDAGYNGWWACLIPSEIVTDVGYPLPLFFQWDDIEYGFRARSRGYATVTLPGAAVWHADFSWKDWDEWHRYFNLRNALITAALHSGFSGWHMARAMIRQLVKYLIAMQYGLAATLIRAVEDFLVGPEALHDGGRAAAREIRELRARYPETVRHPAAQVPGLRFADYPLVDADPEPSMMRAVLLKRVLSTMLGKHARHLGAVRASDAYWWHVSLFKKAVVTDASQEGVRVRSYDRDLMWRLARQGAPVIAALYREAAPIATRYRAALPELSSRENWRRLYGS